MKRPGLAILMLVALCAWGQEHMDRIAACHEPHDGAKRQKAYA